MKAYIYIIFLSVFGVLDCYGQQARIQKHFPRFEDKIDAALFTCDSIHRPQGAGVTEIQFLDDNTLQIINHTPKHPMGGISMEILLDSNLSLKGVTYKEWSDVRTGFDKTFTCESPAVILNANPFKKGINGLQGRFSFIIKTDYQPNETMIQKGEEPFTDFRMFNGRFKYDCTQ